MNLPNAKLVRRLRGNVEEYTVDNGATWDIWTDAIPAVVAKAMPVVQDWNGDERIKSEALAALKRHEDGLVAFR